MSWEENFSLFTVGFLVRVWPGGKYIYIHILYMIKTNFKETKHGIAQEPTVTDDTGIIIELKSTFNRWTFEDYENMNIKVQHSQQIPKEKNNWNGAVFIV